MRIHGYDTTRNRVYAATRKLVTVYTPQCYPFVRSVMVKLFVDVQQSVRDLENIAREILSYDSTKTPQSREPNEA